MINAKAFGWTRATICWLAIDGLADCTRALSGKQVVDRRRTPIPFLFYLKETRQLRTYGLYSIPEEARGRITNFLTEV